MPAQQPVAIEKLRGKISLIHGSEDTVVPILISIAMKLHDNGRVLFIDTMHSLTPQYVARTYHKKLRKPLNNLLIARPQTGEELVSFVGKLNSLFEKSKFDAIIICSINAQFHSSPDLMKADFSAMIDTIEGAARRNNMYAFIGNLSDAESRSAILNKILAKKIEYIYAV